MIPEMPIIILCKNQSLHFCWKLQWECREYHTPTQVWRPK